MNKDLCLLGLLALAYLYLDAPPAAPAPTGELADAEQPAARGTLQVAAPGPRHQPAAPACPRDAAHPISRRADGALWCRGCDEGFYPRSPEWDWIMEGVAA